MTLKNQIRLKNTQILEFKPTSEAIRICLSRLEREGMKSKKEKMAAKVEEKTGKTILSKVEKARKTIRLIADKLKDKQRRLDEWRAL